MKLNSTFDQYPFVTVADRAENGFKMMNNDKKMLKQILPFVNNQGEMLSKQRAEIARLEREELEKVLEEADR